MSCRHFVVRSWVGSHDNVDDGEGYTGEMIGQRFAKSSEYIPTVSERADKAKAQRKANQSTSIPIELRQLDKLDAAMVENYSLFKAGKRPVELYRSVYVVLEAKHKKLTARLDKMGYFANIDVAPQENSPEQLQWAVEWPSKAVSSHSFSSKFNEKMFNAYCYAMKRVLKFIARKTLNLVLGEMK